MFRKMLGQIFQDAVIVEGGKAIGNLVKNYRKRKDSGFTMRESIKGSCKETKDLYLSKITGETPKEYRPLFIFEEEPKVEDD